MLPLLLMLPLLYLLSYLPPLLMLPVLPLLPMLLKLSLLALLPVSSVVTFGCVSCVGTTVSIPALQTKGRLNPILFNISVLKKSLNNFLSFLKAKYNIILGNFPGDL